LFELAKYHAHVLDILWSQRHALDFDPNQGFNIFPPQGEWEIVTWRTELLFEATGHRFVVYETYSRDPSGNPLRRRNYRLTDSDGQQIFLFDTHGKERPFDEACHVHTANGEVLENDHGKLCGYDLADMDFLKAFSLAYQYIFDGEGLPWE
jgi:hypothetical protein